MRRFWLSMAAGVLAVPGLFNVALAEEPPAPDAIALSPETITETIRVDGTVEAINQATLTAQTSGRVKAVHYDVDDYVTAGSVVIELENDEQRARLDQAQAQQQEVQAAVEEAEKNFARVEQLLEKGTLSQSDYDKSKAALERARARLEQARAAVAQAQQQLDYTLIKAPYTGIVTERFIEPGELAQPGRRLIAGLSLERIRVTASVPQQYVDQVRRQKRLTVLLPGQARVTSDEVTVFPYADEQSHSFRIRAELDPEVGGIYPGMFVKVEVVTGQRETLLVPEASLLSRGELQAVYVLDQEGAPQLRQVRTGKRHDNGIEILAGLRAGERIAADARKAMQEVTAGEAP